MPKNERIKTVSVTSNDNVVDTICANSFANDTKTLNEKSKTSISKLVWRNKKPRNDNIDFI